MLGDFNILNRIASLHKDNPIKQSIGDKEVLKIMQVINDEQWRETLRLKQFTNFNAINMPGLGAFKTKMSPLKKYIYLSIKQLRRLRKRIEKVKAENPNFDPNNSMTQKIHDDLVIKVRAAWAQLNNHREIIIMRTLRANAIKRKNNKESEIKVLYENFDWKFINKYLKDE
jgi:hypothetical protein